MTNPLIHLRCADKPRRACVVPRGAATGQRELARGHPTIPGAGSPHAPSTDEAGQPEPASTRGTIRGGKTARESPGGRNRRPRPRRSAAAARASTARCNGPRSSSEASRGDTGKRAHLCARARGKTEESNPSHALAVTRHTGAGDEENPARHGRSEGARHADGEDGAFRCTPCPGGARYPSRQESARRQLAQSNCSLAY